MMPANGKPAKFSTNTEAELERCNQEQREIAEMREKPLWLLMLGHADWEAEKELIQGDEAT